jgi:glycosyltransferase involved in cell wall biosynthesis
MILNGVSIILCTYNGKAFLAETLKHLARLIRPASTPVELLFIDNASTDGSARAAEKLWEQYSNPYPLKLLPEPQPGLVFARKKGIENSQFDLLLFVDDDNWLAPDYLQQIFLACARWPNAGAIGGHNTPIFETSEPFWFKDFNFSYAVGKLAKAEGAPVETGLFGAGLTLKKKALIDLYEKGFESRLVGRNGKSLSSGEDYEFCKALKIFGWDIIYCPEMKLQHYIPAGRLLWDYYKKLNQGISQSIIYFMAYDYWIEKDNSGNKLKTWLKFTWLFQTIKNWLKVLYLKVAIIANPEYCSEGSTVLMELERTRVIAIDFIQKRKDYVALKRTIRDAGWRKQNR